MRKLFLALTLCFAAMAQSQSPAGTNGGVVAVTQLAPVGESTFNQAYLLHQPLAVEALMKNQDYDQRLVLGMQLASQGYSIDVPIMIWGWSPYKVMTQRENYGYAWVPSALMPPVTMAPGVVQPGAVAYDAANPPAGAIKVSLNLADYPPFVAPPPPPPPPAPAVSLVGVSEGAGYFQAISNVLPDGTKLSDGASYTDPSGRGVFTYHQSQSPFAPNGVVRWFTLNTSSSLVCSDVSPCMFDVGERSRQLIVVAN